MNCDMRKVLILDTSILCIWLRVPFMDDGGKEKEWDYAKVNSKILNEIQEKTILVLPLASIIETGNHITHIKGDNYNQVQSFSQFILESINGHSPWAAFTEQSSLWGVEGLTALVNRWKDTAMSRQSLGDASIVDVAEYYSSLGCIVEILTADAGLKSYQPVHSAEIPRRRKK